MCQYRLVLNWLGIIGSPCPKASHTASGPYSVQNPEIQNLLLALSYAVKAV